MNHLNPPALGHGVFWVVGFLLYSSLLSYVLSVLVLGPPGGFLNGLT